MTALLFTVVLKFNFCQHWQMPCMLILGLLYMEKAKHTQRSHVCELIIWLTNRLTMVSHFWAVDKIHLRSVVTVSGEVRGIWMKKEESDGSGE